MVGPSCNFFCLEILSNSSELENWQCFTPILQKPRKALSRSCTWSLIDHVELSSHRIETALVFARLLVHYKLKTSNVYFCYNTIVYFFNLVIQTSFDFFLFFKNNLFFFLPGNHKNLINEITFCELMAPNQEYE